MTKLTGSEKQVKWAEEIRAGFENLLPTLKDAERKVKNPTVEVVEHKDPLRGTVKKVEVVKTGLTNEHEAAVSVVRPWWPDYVGREGIIPSDKKEDFYGEVVARLEGALKNEESASYWIDRRAE